MRNLDIDLLRTFAAVADTGSFTAAAGVVARTQSAVSMQVQRLEASIGRRVLERSSRALSLTRDGETLLAYARRMLQLNDESLQHLLRAPVRGEARLGVTEYFVPNELPRILARFAQRHPGVRLDVTMGLSRDLRAHLAAGRLDAAIVRADENASVASVLWSEPQHWVAADSFRLERGATVPLVAMPEGCVLRAFAIETLRRQKRPWRLAFSGSGMQSVQAAVLAGLGVSIVSRACILPGMRILERTRAWPDPGALQVAVVEGKDAPRAIVQALEEVTRESLVVLQARR